MKAVGFSFTKLVVSDLDISEHFYRDVFGMRSFKRHTATEHEYAQEEVMLSLTGTSDSHVLILTRYLKRPTPVSGAAWTGFVVSDMNATLAAAEKSGGKTAVPMHESLAHRVCAAIIADPEGHMIELVQMLKGS